MASVVLLGTLDTKGNEYAFLRSPLDGPASRRSWSTPAFSGSLALTPDVTRDDVARAAGADVGALAAAGDRGPRWRRWRAARPRSSRGSTPTSVSTASSGSVARAGRPSSRRPCGRCPSGSRSSWSRPSPPATPRPYVGANDITMMYSVVDIAGINPSRPAILSNAAGAMAGMAKSEPPGGRREAPRRGHDVRGHHPVRDRGPGAARGARLRSARLPRHRHGRAVMEALIADGFIAGSLDVTTTELADELVGGVLSAGPRPARGRRRARDSRRSSPSGARHGQLRRRETVPDQFHDRHLYMHNPTVTLMRTTPEECAELGRRIGRKLNAATGPVTLFLPLRGVSLSPWKASSSTIRPPTTRSSTRLRETRDRRVEVRELDRTSTTPLRGRDGRQRSSTTIAACGRGCLHDAPKPSDASARRSREGRPDRRRRRRHGALGEVRRGAAASTSSSSTTPAASAWPGAVARRPDALRRRQRHRHGDGRRGAPVVRATPVLAGVCGTDPFRLMEVFLRQLQAAGFSGVQNFPTVGLIDGIFRRTSRRPAWATAWRWR